MTEGITELLTGWILKARFADCYGTWQHLDDCCFLTPYERYVKPWFYLCSHVITIDQLLTLYLDNSLRSPIAALVKLLRQAGLSDFKNIFRVPYAASFEMFLDELHDALGQDFADFQGSPITNFDLSECR
jgi:hypothetical protein